jgi:hypothetical protein
MKPSLNTILIAVGCLAVVGLIVIGVIAAGASPSEPRQTLKPASVGTLARDVRAACHGGRPTGIASITDRYGTFDTGQDTGPLVGTVAVVVTCADGASEIVPYRGRAKNE